MNKASRKPARRLPVGAEVSGTGAHFRVWAPRRKAVSVVLESGRAKGELRLEPEEGGYFSGLVEGARAGDLYRYRLGDAGVFSDPVSRFQPDGPEGPSQIVDPAEFSWTDAAWEGASLRGQVIYEMHIGTFTEEGTWASAAAELPPLAELGVTVLEILPVADFPGDFGWGYDGTHLFAPYHGYGTPEELRQFIDRAHRLGLAVILDVVYNHFGPRGTVLDEYSANYFSERHKSEWGKAINFDGPQSGPVREFVLANVGYWVEEFRFDGLRLDATQAIQDDTADHILAAIGRTARAASKGRATIIINENEPQEAKMIRSVERGGYGLDGSWNDDFHHSAMVALTGRAEAYYSDHHGSPQEFISAAKYGYLFQGQRYAWQEKRRGTPALDLEPWRFINYMQNHDQVANSGSGARCHAMSSLARYRAMTALLILSPGTPMLFQGQEFAASTPFYYFADHEPGLAEQIRQGRAEFLSQFRHLDHPGLADEVPAPGERSTFEASKLDLRERQKGMHARIWRFHKDLLALRRTDPAFSLQERGKMDGAVLGQHAFLLRFFVGGGGDRLLLINFGPDLHLEEAPEPLLAPPENSAWKALWSSEEPIYGGEGISAVEALDGWRVIGESAVVLAPELLPPFDAAKRRHEAEECAKKRRRRERTRLLE